MGEELKRRLLAPLSTFVCGFGSIFILFSMVIHKEGSIKYILTGIGAVFVLIGAMMLGASMRLNRKYLEKQREEE